MILQINIKNKVQQKPIFCPVLLILFITCESRHDICTRDLGRSKIVDIGVIPSQPIGEPGKQLTLRIFQIGGITQKGVEQSKLKLLWELRI